MAEGSRPLSILLVNQCWLRPELEALGYHVRVATYNNTGDDLDFSQPGCSLDEILEKGKFIPDRVVVLDNSFTPWFTGLERSGIPSVFLSVDTHHHHRWHNYYAQLFDKVLVAQRYCILQNLIQHEDVEWFPLWASNVVEPQEKIVNVAFRGTFDPILHPERWKFYGELAKQVDCDIRPGPWQESYPISKIVVNQSVGNDLNFRVFEAMISGALLLTPKIECGIEELFVEGEDYVTYEPGSSSSAAEVIRRYLSDESGRERIAKNGRDKVLRSHTPAKRAEKLSEILKNLERKAVSGRTTYALKSFLPTLISSQLHGEESVRPPILSAAFNLGRGVLYDLEFTGGKEDCYELLLVMFFLKESGCYEDCAAFSREAQLRYADYSDLFSLFELDAYLNLNDTASASRRAAELSQSPEELLLSIPSLLSGIGVKLREHFL